MGSDVGGAVNEFKKAMNENKSAKEDDDSLDGNGTTIEGEVTKKTTNNASNIKEKV